MVSILILMDYSFWPNEVYLENMVAEVSILILMDYSFWLLLKIGLVIIMPSLNPYSDRL